MNVVDEVFSRLFPRSPSKITLWQKVATVFTSFDVNALGERLAIAFLCEVANYVEFPEFERNVSYSQRAADFISEILGIDPERIGATELEIIQHLLQEDASVEEIKMQLCALRN